MTRDDPAQRMIGFVGDVHRLFAETEAAAEVSDLGETPDEPGARADRKQELKAESLAQSRWGNAFHANGRE